MFALWLTVLARRLKREGPRNSAAQKQENPAKARFLRHLQYWQNIKLGLNMAYFVRFFKHHDAKCFERDSILFSAVHRKDPASSDSTSESSMFQCPL